MYAAMQTKTKILYVLVILTLAIIAVALKTYNSEKLGGTVMEDLLIAEPTMSFALSQTNTIDSLLVGKTPEQRRSIKAEVVARAVEVGKFTRTYKGKDTEIEIVGGNIAKQGDGFVTVFIRAWDIGKGNKKTPHGFGKDGTTETERVRIVNPPTLVQDPSGEIVREVTNYWGSTTIVRYRQDPQEALLNLLTIIATEHGTPDAAVVAGTVGNTIDTVYADDAAANSFDSINYRFGVAEVWATIIAGAGNRQYDSSYLVSTFRGAGTTDNWERIMRSFITFPTSGVGSDTVSSSTIYLGFDTAGNGKLDESSNAPTYNMYASGQADPDALADADMTTCGTTAFSSGVSYASWSTTAYNKFVLNASGLANINNTSSKFCWSNHYVQGAATPTWGASKYSQVGADSSNTAGTSQDPLIIIEHAAGGGAIPAFPTQIIFFNSLLWFINKRKQ